MKTTLLTLLLATLLVAGFGPSRAYADEVPSAHPAGTGPTEAGMKQALQRYLDGFNRGDAELLASLFADEATIEDPVGGGRIVQGKEAIEAFYRRAVGRVERLELDAPIRGSHGRAAAMAFTIHLSGDGERKRIRAIDVMSFDDSGRILTMKAYHGPTDVIE